MKASEAAAVIAWIEAATEHDFADPTKTIWLDFMADLTLQEAMHAARLMVSTSSYKPNIADFRRAVATSRALPSPEQAWIEARRRARGGGDGPDPHPLIDRAIEVVGIDVIRMSYEDEPWMRKDFMRVYEGIRDGEERRVAAAPALTPGAPAELRALAERIGKDPS